MLSLTVLVAAGPAASQPARSQQDGGESCGSVEVDEYGLPIDPDSLVPCDELPVFEDGPNPSPTPVARIDLPAAEPGGTGSYADWRRSTAAALTDELFQTLLVDDGACLGVAFLDQPYEGRLRVPAGTTVNQAATSALAAIPDEELRRLFLDAANALLAAGDDCRLAVGDWLEHREVALGLLDGAIARLAALEAAL